MNSVYNDCVLDIRQRMANRKTRFAMKRLAERSRIAQMQLKKYEQNTLDNRWAKLTNRVQNKIEGHLCRVMACARSAKLLRKKRQTLKRIEKLLSKRQTKAMGNSKVSRSCGSDTLISIQQDSVWNFRSFANV